jgi:alginate O-acetyltransferase complex protein AlgI
MLFNSAIFLFAFLPVTLAGYFAALRFAGRRPAQLWLFAASLFFYGWWNPVYLPLIVASMMFNYGLGLMLLRRRDKKILAAGIAANLMLLGYFKYTGFLLGQFGVTGVDIILPLGISFFTFQKIAFLVDCHRREVPKQQNWINFGLFVTFFPQLIAGPIVHHREMMPQMDKPKGFSAENMAVGLCLLAIGLFKKTIIADGLDAYATPLFTQAETQPLHMVAAWVAMLSYTFQIYFDFSGYSDMALGIARMFGVRLPVNFFSPYKSASIVDFWRRWHMTLSRFLRDYLYIPLGGNRKGAVRRHVNLFLTMLLGGLWHGANWTFVIWGAMHGVFLIINHAWRGVGIAMPAWIARSMTFLCVALAWVFFRAADAGTALSMIASLVHVTDLASGGLFGKTSPLRALFGAAEANRALILIVLCVLVTQIMPNSIEIMRRGKPAIGGVRGFFPLPRSRTSDMLAWQPRLRWGIACGIVLALCIAKVLYEPSNVFLYFQF